MGAELYHIASREDAELDTSRILVLRQSLGDQRCREVVSEVVFHLTDRLGLLQTALAAAMRPRRRCWPRGSRASASRSASRTFARVARDLVGCLAAERPGRGRRGRRPAGAARRGIAVLGDPLC